MGDADVGMYLPGPREGRGVQSFSSRRVKVPRLGQTCGVVVPYGVFHPATAVGGTPTQKRLSDLFPGRHAFRECAQTLRLLDQIEVRACDFPLASQSISNFWPLEMAQDPSSI